MTVDEWQSIKRKHKSKAGLFHAEVGEDGNISHAEILDKDDELIFIYPEGSRKRRYTMDSKFYGSQWGDFKITKLDEGMSYRKAVGE